MRYTLAVLAYVVPTFAPGIVWHLVLFDGYDHALAIYRPDIIIPFGFLSMLVQAAIFAWIYQKAFAQRDGTPASRALAYGAVGAVLSWSFTTLAVAAKIVMTSPGRGGDAGTKTDRWRGEEALPGDCPTMSATAAQ